MTGLVVLGLLLGLSACQNRLDGSFTGPFTVQDCYDFMVSAGAPESDAVRMICNAKLQELGQDGFDSWMSDAISAAAQFNETYEKLLGN